MSTAYDVPRSTVLANLPNILGRGVSFPIQRSQTGGLKQSEGVDKVEESIMEIITTPIGYGVRAFDVRGGVPYGTRLMYYLFESVEQVREVGPYEIRRALEVWEPRIAVRAVQAYAPDVAGDSNAYKTVAFTIGYVLRATNRADNLVVPVMMRRAA